MSTAIMHTTSFFDFGELHLKNHSASRALSHLSNTVQTNQIVLGSPSMPALPTTAAHTNSTNITANSTNNLLSNNLYNGTTTTTATDNNNHHSINNNNNNLQQSSTMLQQQINAAAAAMVAQQQQHHKLLLHNALTRAVSHPQGDVVSLVNSFIENLGGHRKLERTQSEPLPQVNTSRYKTELCRPFEEAGECKYGEKCQFAHGAHELRNLQRHPKYKTELCRTFHSVGFCPYGPRCHFVHNAEEARNHNRAVHAAYVRAAAAAGQPIPLSPPMSMSTGSDRASPTGSLSLSPTNSMANFFPDQTSPTFSQGFSFPSNNSPPATPRNVSPLTTPPPGDEARLPIFNQLSSTIDAFNHLAM